MSEIERLKSLIEKAKRTGSFGAVKLFEQKLIKIAKQITKRERDDKAVRRP